MDTQKITVRLPVQLIHAVDTFINMGEFASRSEAIRRALKKLVDELMNDFNKKAEMWKKLQELQVFTGEIEKLRKK
jgi:Arc/MetJ-type ribon-helix-helix transcriptional regulator